MDEFAQSREDDDLFADEFEPLSEPTAIVENPIPRVPNQPESTPSEAHPSQNGRSAAPSAPTGNTRNARGRGRGGRGRGETHSGLGQSRYAPHNETPQPTAAPASTSIPPASEPATETPQLTPQSNETGTPSTTTQIEPTQPTPPTIAIGRPPAVRGDRSATGGPLHKKLTEEELTAKLAQMAIINAQKSERHRLSEADQAAFQHREKELAKERREKMVEEKKNSRQMEMERAKNRERKMKAQGGREWDSEKVEADIVDRTRGRTSEQSRDKR